MSHLGVGVLVCCAIVSLVSAEDPSRVIQGIVTDAASRRPIGGASVRSDVAISTATTTESGTFRLLFPPRVRRGAVVRVRVEKFGYRSLNQDLTVGDQIFPVPLTRLSTQGTRTSGMDLRVEIAPLVVLRDVHYHMDNTDVHGARYGLAVIAKVANGGRNSTSVTKMCVTGRIDLTFQQYLSHLPNTGLTLESCSTEFHTKKPYVHISWVSWPSGIRRIDGESEEYVRFEVIPPQHLGTTVYTGDPLAYLGYLEGTHRPQALTRTPSLDLIVTFLRSQPDFIHVLSPRLKEEFSSAVARFSLFFDSQRNSPEHVIPAQLIRMPYIVSEKEWESVTSQELFHRTNAWDRSAPSGRDELTGARVD